MGQPTPALSRLLGSRASELPAAWGETPLLTGGSSTEPASDFSDLFSAEAVDTLLCDRGLRTPFLRLAKDGRTLGESAYTRGGGVGAGIADQVDEDAVRRLFSDGATIVLQGLHRTWAPIRDFSHSLAAELGHPIQVNAYITPAESQGFAAHYDVHDVFVVQIAGRKRWLIHPPVLPAPLRNQPWEVCAAQVDQRATETPAIDTVLAPGDVCYLPRGHIHSARALGGVSIHLTMGIHAWTVHHVAEAYLDALRAELASDVRVRASLPLGVDITDPAQLGEAMAAVRDAMAQASAAISADRLATTLHSRASDSQRPEALAPLRQVADAAQLTPGRFLRARAHLLARPKLTQGRLVIDSRAGRCEIAAEHGDALGRLLAGEHVGVGDFGEDAATLVRGGVAIVTEPI